VLTGTGPVFCSGADLKEKAGPSEPDKVAGLAPTLLQMWEGPKPVLGRINGAARAGGLGLVTACDIAVGIETATFGLSEVRLGLIPAIISVVMVPKLGQARMMDLTLTGEPFDGRAAVGYGLLNAAVPPDKLDEAVAGYLGSLMKGAPKALGGCKQLIRDVGRMSMVEAFAEMSVRTERYFQSEEGREGMAAFAEKRLPWWQVGG
jgi:methylglutaconyl-CoA hydratase